MATTVQMSEETAAIVQRKVEQGLYADAASAVAEAVRRLDEDDRYERELHAQLQVGQDQIERGEVREWSRALNDRLFEEALELYRSGVKPSADARP